jgi:hypothetical protein
MAKQPRWALADALRRARVAFRLADKHKLALEPRLPAGLLGQLLADRALLGDGAAGSVMALVAQKVATSAERATSERAHRMVMKLRNLVKRSGDHPTLRTALGVGDELRAGDTVGVVAALQRIATHAAELAPLGVLADDVAKAQALATQLAGADVKQAGAMDARASTTEDRVDAHLRVEQAIDRISAVGTLAFDEDDAASQLVAARFERLVETSGPSADDEAELGDEPAPPAPPAPPAT